MAYSLFLSKFIDEETQQIDVKEYEALKRSCDELLAKYAKEQKKIEEMEKLIDELVKKQEAKEETLITKEPSREYYKKRRIGKTSAKFETPFTRLSLDSRVRNFYYNKKGSIKKAVKLGIGLATVGFLLYMSINYVPACIKEHRQNKQKESSSRTSSMNTTPLIKEHFDTRSYIKKRNLPSSLYLILERYPWLDYIIYINKEQNRTYLFEVNNSKVNENPLFVWKSIDGRGGKGPKESKNDYKTPEGIYQIERLGKANHSFYGTYYIRLNYPNKVDKLLGRTGGEEGSGILICGTWDPYMENNILRGDDITNGGIRLLDKDMITLYKKIEYYWKSTLIVIEGSTKINERYLNLLDLK